MDKKIEKLIALCLENPVDMEAVAKAVDRLEDINADVPGEDNENILSLIISSFGEMYYDERGYKVVKPVASGEYLPYIIRLFIEKGFAVNKNMGKFGGRCFVNLCRSSSDKYIIDAAKVLLENGVVPNVSLVFEKSVSEVKDCVAEIIENEINLRYDLEDFKTAGYLHTLNTLARAYLYKKNWRKIHSFEKAIGKRINSVKVFDVESFLNPDSCPQTPLCRRIADPCYFDLGDDIVEAGREEIYLEITDTDRNRLTELPGERHRDLNNCQGKTIKEVTFESGEHCKAEAVITIGFTDNSALKIVYDKRAEYIFVPVESK